MLQYLALVRLRQPCRHPRRCQVALLTEIDADHAHGARIGITRGIDRHGTMIGVDEALNFSLIPATPGRRTIFDRTGLEQGDEGDE